MTTTPVLTREIREFLRAGLTELRTRPWVQYMTHRESDGGCCAMGALFAAQRHARRDGHAVEAWCLLAAHEHLENAARYLSGIDNCTVPGFNDEIAETKDDVIKLFERAIADCD